MKNLKWFYLELFFLSVYVGSGLAGAGAGARGTCPGRMVVWEDGSIMVAFTGCDADIATRVTSMGDMTGMVFLLLRKHTVPADVRSAMAASG